jgi:hypothetical protein
MKSMSEGIQEIMAGRRQKLASIRPRRKPLALSYKCCLIFAQSMLCGSKFEFWLVKEVSP